MEVAFTTKRTRGGACVDNVWCPNPGQEKSKRVVKNTAQLKTDRQSIYNLSGQLLLTVDRAPWLHEWRRSIHLVTLPAGIYFVRTLYTDGTTTTQKIFIGND